MLSSEGVYPDICVHSSVIVPGESVGWGDFSIPNFLHLGLSREALQN